MAASTPSLQQPNFNYPLRNPPAFNAKGKPLKKNDVFRWRIKMLKQDIDTYSRLDCAINSLTPGEILEIRNPDNHEQTIRYFTKDSWRDFQKSWNQYISSLAHAYVHKQDRANCGTGVGPNVGIEGLAESAGCRGARITEMAVDFISRSGFTDANGTPGIDIVDPDAMLRNNNIFPNNAVTSIMNSFYPKSVGRSFQDTRDSRITHNTNANGNVNAIYTFLKPAFYYYAYHDRIQPSKLPAPGGRGPSTTYALDPTPRGFFYFQDNMRFKAFSIVSEPRMRKYALDYARLATGGVPGISTNPTTFKNVIQSVDHNLYRPVINNDTTGGIFQILWDNNMVSISLSPETWAAVTPYLESMSMEAINFLDQPRLGLLVEQGLNSAASQNPNITAVYNAALALLQQNWSALTQSPTVVNPAGQEVLNPAVAGVNTQVIRQQQGVNNITRSYAPYKKQQESVRSGAQRVREREAKAREGVSMGRNVSSNFTSLVLPNPDNNTSVIKTLPVLPAVQ